MSEAKSTVRNRTTSQSSAPTASIPPLLPIAAEDLVEWPGATREAALRASRSLARIGVLFSFEATLVRLHDISTFSGRPTELGTGTVRVQGLGSQLWDVWFKAKVSCLRVSSLG